MTKKQRYWDIHHILAKGADYNIVFGERSNGKSYGVLKYAIEQYWEKGIELAYIRRYKEDVRGNRAAQVFTAIIDDDCIRKITGGEYSNVSYYSGRWYLSNYDEQLNKFIRSPNPFAYAFSLSDMEHDKSAAYPKVGIVLFDEFLTRRYYLQDEFVIFLNVLSTIIRQRDNVKIFMLGNTVNKYCPYFEEFGLKHIAEMEQGKIDVYTYGKKGLKIAVEFCGNKKSSKPSDKYFAFDNPKLKMITNGAWELAIYPHLPSGYKIKPIDIIFRYFIIFNDNILEADIVSTGDSVFTYIHAKTTPIKNPDTDLIYTMEDSTKSNYCRDLLSTATPIQSKVTWFYSAKKVFFQSNEIGEIVRNYIMQTSRKRV